MLNDALIKEIQKNGPLRLDQFMQRALFDAEEGYYSTKHVFGRKGDFVTSPEISQIFGEMIAIFIASTMAAWREEQTALGNYQLVEIGPGRGTLMHDMLRTMQFMPDHVRPTQVMLVEASSNLQGQQEHLLKPFIPEEEIEFLEWHDALDSLPKKPSIIVANEFFDALPIRQFEYQHGKWIERMVGADGDQLSWTNQAVDTLPEGLVSLGDETDGCVLEYSAAAREAMAEIAAKMAKDKGVAIIIDYGYSRPAYGDSLQAVKKHAYANVLEDVGEVDITAHVNFNMLKTIAEEAGLQVHALTTQEVFLRALGAEMRLERLCQSAEPAQIIDLISGLKRLMDPNDMGTLFKVLIVASPDVPVIQMFG